MSHSIGLQITLRDGRSREETYETDTILIGSGPSAVLRLEDVSVSSIHAVMKLGSDGSLTVIDLGSESGTSINGRTILEPSSLEVGDDIVLGRVKLTLIRLGEKRLTAGSLGSVADDLTEASTLEIQERSRADTRPGTDQAPHGAQHDAQPGGLGSLRRPSVADLEPSSDDFVDTDSGREDLLSKSSAESGSDSEDESTPESVQGFVWGPADRASSRASVGPKSGQSLVSASGPVDLKVLARPLAAEDRPTAEQRALQITVLWGAEVVDTVLVTAARPVTVGGRNSASWLTKNFSAQRAFDLEVEGPLPAETFTVAVNRGQEAQIVVPAEADVAVRRSDGQISKEVVLAPTDAPFAAKSYTLTLGERLAFKVGTLTFVSEFVRGDARMGKRAALDWYFPRAFAISALLHVFFVVAAYITPESQRSLVDELFKNQSRFATMILKAPEKEKKQTKLDLSGMKGGAKHKGEEGKFGKKDLPKRDALASKAGAPRVDPNKREKDRKIALNAGLLGVLKGAGGEGAVSNVFGPGGLGTGINNAMGGLRGTAMGDAGGAGGLGTRGTGSGGGGNSLGIGGLGTHGHGRGTGGFGNIDLGGKGKGTTRIVPGRTVVQGALTKDEIGRVIHRNLPRFKYCYEKQLASNPNLSGKVAVYFTVAPTGAVAQASIRESSIKDTNVESCVATVMRSLKFPKPRGGGIVVVTYPFVFEST